MLERWRERDVFHESIRRREGAPPFVFYEGPPTANGRPGSHHVLSRVFKDVFPRYKTMRGHLVPRKARLGLPRPAGRAARSRRSSASSNKHDIERYGVAEFNAKCRESVLRYIDEWNALTERIGFWIDTDDAYFTLDNDYVESVWWSLKQVWEKGLLVEGHKVVPYCTALRHGAVLARGRARLPATWSTRRVFVRFPLVDEPGVSLLAWTTMPWTLVPHAAIAVDPEVTYVRARLGDETLILAEALVERVLGEGAEIESRMPGLGAARHCATSRPSPTSRDYGERATPCWPATSSRSRTAPASCTPARPSARTTSGSATDNGLTIHNPVRPDGTFDERAGPFAGMYVRDADAHDRRGAARVAAGCSAPGEYEHAYPHCWRCDTPLIYYAKTSWYVRTTARCKDELLAANETINWHPEHIKHGRFGKWLENNVDWALSRERYWGTPLPVWRCADDAGHVVCVGSLDGDRASAAAPRPRTCTGPTSTRSCCTCEDCGGEMRRVPDLIDVWWDSGCMPFAQWHAPFENEDEFERELPGRLHLRGARPDARLVLLAARRVGAAVRPAPRTGRASASA